MANQFLNAQEYSNVMLLLLKNQLVFGKLVDGQYKNEVTDENGLTVNVKRPPRFLDKKDGTANLAAQDIVTGSAPVKVDQYSKVHLSVGDIEYVSSYNELMRNASMRSAASTLAHSIDRFIAQQTLGFNSWVAGQEPNVGGDVEPNANGLADCDIQSPAQAMSAHTRLMDFGVPNESLSGVVPFADGQRIRGSLMSSFEPGDINRPALERVRIPIISEIDWYGTQQLPTLTMGTRTQGDGAAAGGQIAGAGQIVNYRDVKGAAGAAQMTSTINVDGLTAGQTIKKGEVFTIQGCYQWDWRALQPIPRLQQFTLTADVVVAGGGTAALVVSPPVIVQGTVDATGNADANTVFGTVNVAPADNAFIQFVGAPSSLWKIRPVFHKRAISLVSARLIMPFTGTASFAVDPDTGIAVRYWRGSDISTGAHIHRWDCMYGAAVMDPNLGTRVSGQLAGPHV